MATTARGAKRGECEKGYACQPKRGERLHGKGKQTHVRQTQLLGQVLSSSPTHRTHREREEGESRRWRALAYVTNCRTVKSCEN